MTTCKEQIAALVECARRDERPDAALMAHLAECEACDARWQSELALTGQFRAMRAQAMANDAGSQARRDIRAAALMRELAKRHEPVTMMPSRVLSWGWMLSAAAAVLLAIGIGYGVRMRTRHLAADPARTDIVYEASADDDFIDVPYALPPVPGEIVSIVHSDFYPGALASMGIDFDWQSDDPDDISADVVVGQDGFPRAVRITEASDAAQF